MKYDLVARQLGLAGLALVLVACNGLLLQTPPGTETALTPKQRGVWLIGGLSTSSIGSVLAAVDLYDPVQDAWYPGVTSLPTPVSFAAASFCNGRLYVMGGFNAAGTVLATVQIYDLDDDSWSAGTSMPAARANAYAATVNGRIYVLGGTTLNAAATPWTASNLTFEYTPGGTWSTKANYAAANYSERFLLPFNDVIYNFGGRTTATTVTTAHDGFAVTTNGLSQGTEVVLAPARTGIAGVLYTPASGPALMAIVGGFTSLTTTNGNFVGQSTGTSLSTSAFQYLYYPFTAPASWQSPVSQYPFSIGFSAAALSGSRIYVFGGTDVVTAAANGLNIAYSFDLSNLAGTWTAAASMPAGRYGHAAVTVQ
ncbi:MAG: hypothetical protein A2064_07715 [Spirochaetes bacterium GWB1_66_5]|nr:MAG: hypothetical protein A2064_07715 [Spirochaetes bacterium GWB1_66_5]